MTQIAPGAVIVDVAGTELQAHERARLAHPSVGGVILFTRNFASRAQVSALVAEIRASRTGPLLICVDHEGGRVQRFRTDGFTRLPAMARLGELYAQDRAAALRGAAEVGYVLAAELRSCDIDLSFAPVLDLDLGRSAVIGDRALGRDPFVVAALARALMLGMARAGMSACGKHFPGHGWALADSHVALPVDDRAWEQIAAQDVVPYRQLGDVALPSVMPAHVVYPAVDPKMPAGFSRRWIHELLRGELAYSGAVISDDLCMEGAAVAGNMLARAQAARAAGCDMVLVCNRPDLADQLLQELDWVPQGASAQRVARLLGLGSPKEWNTLQAELSYQQGVALCGRLC